MILGMNSGIVDDVECARVYGGYARVECGCQRSCFSCCVLGCVHLALMKNHMLFFRVMSGGKVRPEVSRPCDRRMIPSLIYLLGEMALPQTCVVAQFREKWTCFFKLDMCAEHPTSDRVLRMTHSWLEIRSPRYPGGDRCPVW